MQQSPEGYLCAEFHFNIINLVNTANHQINLDICWTIICFGRTCGSYSRIVDLLVENTIKNVLFLQSLICLLKPAVGGSLKGAPITLGQEYNETP